MNAKHEWPHDFDDDSRETVVAGVMAYYAERDVATVVEGDRVLFPESPERHAMSLGSIAAQCAKAPTSMWPTIIGLHLDDVERVALRRSQVAADLAHFVAVVDKLTVQLRTVDESLDATNHIGRDALPGMRLVLTLDLVDTVHTVHPDEAAPWGKTHDELLEIGIAHVRDQLSPVVRAMDVNLTSSMRMVMSESSMGPFVSASALWLEDIEGAVGTHGALISVTNRDMILSYPIESDDVTDALTALVPLSRKAVAERPHPLGAHIYWRRPDGPFLPIPTRVVDDMVHAELPDEFVALVEYLEGE